MECCIKYRSRVLYAIRRILHVVFAGANLYLPVVQVFVDIGDALARLLIELQYPH